MTPVQWPPVRFNPDGKPNATMDGTEEDAGTPFPYAVFLDPLLKRTPDPLQKWSLSMAVIYLLKKYNTQTFHNAVTGRDQNYVANPAASTITQILDSWVPTVPNGPIDPGDPTSYKASPIDVQDIDVTGHTLPHAIAALINPHNFAFRYVLDQDSNNDPVWFIEFYRTDTDDNIKSLTLQAVGSDIDPSQSNAASITLQRDGDIINAYVGLTAATEVEFCATLAPLFKPAAADSLVANLPKWVLGDPSYDPSKYRLYGLRRGGRWPLGQ